MRQKLEEMMKEFARIDKEYQQISSEIKGALKIEESNRQQFDQWYHESLKPQGDYIVKRIMDEHTKPELARRQQFDAKANRASLSRAIEQEVRANKQQFMDPEIHRREQIDQNAQPVDSKEQEMEETRRKQAESFIEGQIKSESESKFKRIIEEEKRSRKEYDQWEFESYKASKEYAKQGLESYKQKEDARREEFNQYIEEGRKQLA